MKVWELKVISFTRNSLDRLQYKVEPVKNRTGYLAQYVNNQASSTIFNIFLNPVTHLKYLDFIYFQNKQYFKRKQQ